MSEKDIKENIEEVKENEEVQGIPNNVEDKPYQQVIEDARKDLYNSYTTSRRISNIIMFVVVAAIVGIVFMVTANNTVLKIVGYSLAGAILIGMILYYVLSRKKFPEKTKAYVALVADTINGRIFNKPGFKDIQCDKEEKFKLDDLVGDGVYNNATGINSRNIVHGSYKDHHFLYGEAALLRPAQKKQQVPPLFVGRYISMPNQLKFEGRIIITIKNEKEPLDLPNAIDDLVVLEEKNEWVVYGKEGTDYRSLIDNKIISKLKKIEIGNHLLNVNVVFWGGHTAVYISYDDTIMSVPFDKPFDHAGFEKSFEDLQICFDAIVEE